MWSMKGLKPGYYDRSVVIKPQVHNNNIYFPVMKRNGKTEWTVFLPKQD